MKKLFVILNMAWLLFGLACNAQCDSIDQFIAETIKERRIPGVSIAVIRDGLVVREGGYGIANLEHQIPATRDTVYEIGSISKQFAAEAVMLLVEDRKIELDDSIRKHLPPNAPETWQPITIRNLLNHTSGLMDWTEIKEFSYRREYSASEFIELINAFPLQFEPNERWSYSNSNLPLIGIIVEHAGGKPYEAFVNERILKPLRLPSIRLKHQDEIVERRASGYVLKDNAWKNGEPFRPTIIAPSGGILASATDLARWWEAVLRGSTLLQPSSLEQMLMPARLKDGSMVNHGFAFFTDSFNGHKMIFHHGSTVGGFGSVVRHFPNEKLTVAVVVNLEDGGFGPETISKRIANDYIPGCFVGGLNEAEDSYPNQTKESLQLLHAIADGKNPEGLTSACASRIDEKFRKSIFENLSQLRSFKFLGREVVVADHFMLDPKITAIQHFRLEMTNRNVYYHFRCNAAGEIALILSED
jgi:D-alanyl-D-alanine carboxypeptidase